MITTLKDKTGNDFSIEQVPAEVRNSAGLHCLILPGAHMGAERYGWLAKGLAKQGYGTSLISPPIVKRKSPFDSGKYADSQMVSIDQFSRTANHLAEKGYGPLLAIGHSWGGAVLLESFDPATARNIARLEVPDTFDGHIANIVGGIILGASLQAQIMGRTIPGRSNVSRLQKPAGFPLLFVAAEQDAMATPEDIKKTASRYDESVSYVEIAGGNHLQWSEGKGWADRPDLDGEASITAAQQQGQTLDHLSDFISAISGDSGVIERPVSGRLACN